VVTLQHRVLQGELKVVLVTQRLQQRFVPLPDICVLFAQGKQAWFKLARA
jgi:hypothetical protein